MEAGLPVEPSKTIGLVTTITFLGMELDLLGGVIRRLEEKLQATEQQKAELEEEMASAAFYQINEKAVIDQKSALLAELLSKVSTLENEWMMLSSEIEEHQS